MQREYYVEVGHVLCGRDANEEDTKPDMTNKIKHRLCGK